MEEKKVRIAIGSDQKTDASFLVLDKIFRYLKKLASTDIVFAFGQKQYSLVQKIAESFNVEFGWVPPNDPRKLPNLHKDLKEKKVDLVCLAGSGISVKDLALCGAKVIEFIDLNVPGVEDEIIEAIEKGIHELTGHENEIIN